MDELQQASAGCRGLMVAATGSGRGKTIFTAALARYHRRQCKSVQVLKVGPDFLDPMIHEVATGQPVYNLDWWMMGEAHCRALLSDCIRRNDVVLFESLMGLHDNAPSNAWLARVLQLPIALVMDVSRCAQTAAAIVHGMQRYSAGMIIESVVGNRVASRRHHALVEAAMPAGVRYRGSVSEHASFALPARHLGLVQGTEMVGLSAQLDEAADWLVESGVMLDLPDLPDASGTADLSSDAGAVANDDRAGADRLENAGIDGVSGVFDSASVDQPLRGRVIAIARDAAFGFVYPGNVAALQALGARVVSFSVLADEPLPGCDALWLPGGYPELHLERLASCRQSLSSISEHVLAGKPGLAECGGMMLLGRSITTLEGASQVLCGVFEARFTMQRRFQSVGHQWLEVTVQAGAAGQAADDETPDSRTLTERSRGTRTQDAPRRGARIHGHSFHHSTMHTDRSASGQWYKRDGQLGEAVFRQGQMTMTYVHHYFASNPAITATLFGAEDPRFSSAAEQPPHRGWKESTDADRWP